MGYSRNGEGEFSNKLQRHFPAAASKAALKFLQRMFTSRATALSWLVAIIWQDHSRCVKMPQSTLELIPFSFLSQPSRE